MKKAFTLAEIMIVLTVIGVITGILLPIAFHSTPDEKVMKFKKGHATLYKVINELVTSDKYYLDGDLGVRYDGTLVAGSADGLTEYFCSTFADVISTKEYNCEPYATASTGTKGTINLFYPDSHTSDVACAALTSGDYNYVITPAILNTAKEKIDKRCKDVTPTSKIKSIDNIMYFESDPEKKFGVIGSKVSSGCTVAGVFPRFLSPPNQFPAFYHDQNGFDVNYKVFCIDIDGIKEGEDPFGYGIRADGKILNGARADQWLERDIQNRD